MKFIIDGYTVKSGNKDMWFRYDDVFPCVTVDFYSVRLKRKMINKLRHKALNSHPVRFSFGHVSFLAFIGAIESSSKRKFNFSLQSSGEIKHEHV